MAVAFWSVPRTTSPHPRSVAVNGPALRTIRQLLGIAVADIVAALDCNASTISKLETGARPYCSPLFFTALVDYFGIEDRRALMARPYGEDAHEQSGPAHDALADTVELERPALGGEVPHIVAVPSARTDGSDASAPPRGPTTTRTATRRGPRHRSGKR